MTMLQTETNSLEYHGSKRDPILHVCCKPSEKHHVRKAPQRSSSDRTEKAVSTQVPQSKAKATIVPAPIIHTRIPRAFQQLYLAANRGEDPKDLPPCPVRQVPRRTKSCLSSRPTRTSTDNDFNRKTIRSVSFGSIEGKFVENIARENKHSLWFSRDEYTTMRQEAYEIASAIQTIGPLRETSKVSSRGLEKYIDLKQSRDARVSILEHNDIAMYALASNRAVNTARQLAENDAIEAFSFQQESKRNKSTL